MEQILDQALADDYPAHPKFEAEVKTSNLRKVHDVVSQAARKEDGRAEVDKPLRPLIRQIANQLLLGELGPDATHFVLGQHWKNHFTRKAAQSGAALTVGQLRKWMDDPRPMGLPREAASLVILIFAEQTNQTFFEHGGPQEGTLGKLPDHFELKQTKLPEEAAWALAVQRAASILGVAVSPLRKAGNVGLLVGQAKSKAGDHRAGCQGYARRLRERLLGLAIAEPPRLKTAHATLALVERLHAGEGDGLVGVLASAEVATSEAAMGTCLKHAAELSATLDTFNWEILDAVSRLTDNHQIGAAEVLRIVCEALTADEHALALAPALKEAQSKAVRLLTQRPPAPVLEVVTQVDKPVAVAPIAATPRTVQRGEKAGLSLAEAQEQMERLKQEQAAGRTVTVSLAWKIEAGGEQK